MSRDEISKDLLRETETVASLLEQNDDLMARITAYAKKTAELERRLGESTLANSELTRKVELLSEQMLILKEKDQLQKQRHDALIKKAEELVSDRNFQELRHSQLIEKNQDLQKKREATHRVLTDQIKKLARFRDRIKTTGYEKYREMRSENSLLRKRFEELYKQLEETQGELHEHKKALQSSKQEFEERTAELRQDSQNFHEARDNYLKLKEERTVTLNRMVVVERERDEIRELHKQETLNWQEKVSAFRQEAKGLKVENQSLREETQRVQEENKKMHRQTERLRDQNESIQELWNENRRQLEKASDKENALQKLNQELSMQLKESRQEAQNMKKALAEAQMMASKKIQNLSNDLEASTKASTVAKNQALSKEEIIKPTVDKLETLLAEIQSGYSKTIFPRSTANMNFIEKTELMSEEGELEAP